MREIVVTVLAVEEHQGAPVAERVYFALIEACCSFQASPVALEQIH